MADIAASNWTEADASNSTAAPDGWPEGMAPSGVNDSGRAMMGAVKRWYDQTIPLVTGGTSTAYTLSYAVTPTALADGQTHLVQFNAINGAAPTLNVNALGAKPLHFWSTGGWGAWPANMVAIDQIVRVTYNATAGTYRAVNMPMVLRQAVSAVATIDFTGIPANVENIEVTIDLTMATDNVGLQLRFYDSGGSLDSAAVYNTLFFSANSGSTSGITTGTGGTSTTLATSVSNSSTNGCTGVLKIQNIQAVKATEFAQSTYYTATGSLTVIGNGGGARTSNGPITGLRIFATSGNVTGKVTVRAI